ncbi:MAG: UDP-N-acetylglucosamine transferase subunit [Vezdaea acicularis]|nr:MAG: UDP-N-acetylglucosamine transferase subunit [Vezdaea acicularis]
MLALLRRLDTSIYANRTYIVSEGDAFSADKAREFEAAMVSQTKQNADATSYNIITVPRARKIHQPLYTTPFTALRCLLQCIGALNLRQSMVAQNFPDKAVSGLSRYPDLILVNGPGTAVCLVFAWLLLHFFDISYNSDKPKARTIYVESWARVRTLSLSGKILLPFVNRFLVQWKALEGVGGRAEYIGVLV